MTASLLPPNATALERALEGATARLTDIAVPIDTLLDPAAIDAPLLPWLAWALSADSWDADWSEGVKRDAVASSIALHRIKGTRLSVETVLARFDALLELMEWHQAAPRLDPHTFEVRLPLGTAGGTRATAAFAEAIVREVGRVKPLREHFVLVQALATAGTIGLEVHGRPLLMRRDDLAAVDDRSEPWDALLQTEQGEPLQSDDATFLEHAP